MSTKHFTGRRALALLLSFIMVLSMFPQVSVAADEEPAVEMDGQLYPTLEDALYDVPVGFSAPEKTIKLLRTETLAFDLGSEDGNEPQKVVLDLNGQNLNLRPAVGSVGTKSSGIRVLANSKLTVVNGTLSCSDAEADNVKVGIANYGELELRDVDLRSGSKTVYGINNRGKLTLSGSTRIANGTGANFQFGITNDPYEYIYTDRDASVTCNSGSVYVGSMQVERYSRTTTNAGGVVLNISAGTFGSIVEDGSDAVAVTYNITGGTLCVATAAELEQALKVVSNGAVIKLLEDVTMGFDVGTEDGSVSRQVVLDLGGKVLTAAPAVGSVGTKTNGIRVLANSALTLRNGTIVIPDETDDVKIKTGLANYGTLNLESVQVKAGSATVYTINNRGELTLRGSTSVENGTGENFQFAITNDPYNYIYTNKDAVLNIGDSAVTVGKVQLERYERATTNAGGIVLNIAAGTIGTVTEDGGAAVTVTSGITGGVFASDVSAYVKEGYRCVRLENGTFRAEFIKLEQEALSFENPRPEHLVYGVDTEFSNTAVGGSTNGKITYALVSGDCVRVDENTGVVTVLKAGTCRIRATMAGNETYEDVSAEYELTIDRSDREAAFEKTYLEVYYGTASIEAPALTVSAGTGDISYQLVEGSEIAQVDPQTGKLTFLNGGMGTLVVKAVVVADENYNSCAAQFTVDVVALPTPIEAYEIEGAKGGNGWYMDDVKVIAPEGYTMSKTNHFDGDWVDQFTYTEEGTYTETIYLKDENGCITAGVVVQFKIDKTAPSGLNISYAKYTWNDWSELLGKMLGGAADVDVTFTFVETGSGAQLVEFSLDEGVSWKEASYVGGTYSTTVSPEYRGKVQFRVTDAAGWTSECFADGTVLIVDSVEPGLSVAFREGTYRKDGDVIYTSEETFDVTLIVTDDNYDVREAAPKVMVNGSEWPLEWENSTREGKATLTLRDEGEYAIKLVFADRSGNDLVMKDASGEEKAAELTVVVDRTIPELYAEPITAAYATENGQYYYKEAPIQLKLFYKNENLWNMYENMALRFVEWSAGYVLKRNGQQIDASIGKWRKDPNNPGVFYTTLTLDDRAAEGTYELWVTRKEYSLQGEKIVYSEAPLVLTLDKSNPTVTITYQENGGNLIESIRKFLLGKDKVDVTITATDAISEIHHLVYSIGDGNEHTVSAAELDHGSYSFSIQEEYRNEITARAYDMVGLAAEEGHGTTVVIDKTNAVVSVGASAGEDGSYKMTTENGVNTYLTGSEGFQLIFSIEHKNYDARAVEPVIEYRLKNTEWWRQVDEALLTRTEDEADPTKGTVVVSMPEPIIAGKLGDYEFRCTYTLFMGWEYSEAATAVVRYDTKNPEIETIYNAESLKNQVDGVRYFQEAQTVTLRVVEDHFSQEDTKVEVFYQATAADEPVAWDGLNAEGLVWLHENEVHYLDLQFKEEGIYTLKVRCSDMLRPNAVASLDEKIVIDRTAPTNLTVTYQEPVARDTIGGILYWFFNLNNEDDGMVTAVVTAEDAVSGIESVDISMDGEKLQNVTINQDGTYTVSIQEDLRGSLSVRAVDMAKLESTLYEERAVVVDSIAPDVDAKYPAADIHTYADDEQVYTNSDSFTIDFEVADANYDLRADDAEIKIGGVRREDLIWSAAEINGLPGGETSLTLQEEGLYVIQAGFADRSGNAGSWNRTFVVDRTEPRIDVEFTDEAIEYEDGSIFYPEKQFVTVSITEEYFRPDLVELKLVNGEEQELYNAYAKEIQNWTTTGNVHTLTLEVAAGDKYELTITCQDMAGNSAEKDYASEFVVDDKVPELKEIRYNKKAIDMLLEGVTFGFFQAPVQVTITAADDTAGVKSISYIVAGTKGTTDGAEVRAEDSQQPNDRNEITFEVPAAFCGTITAWATDYANHKSAEANVGRDLDGKRIEKIVVDADASERVVSMNPVRIVSAEDMTDHTTFAEGEDKILYFNTAAKIEIRVKEANFFAENYLVEVNEKEQTVHWEPEDAEHVAFVTLEKDGEYVLTVSGQDYSGNQMTTYKSQRIVVDQDAPKIEVEYFEVDESGKLIAIGNTVDPADRDKPIVARVTVRERNFRASDMRMLVTAKNSMGNDILELDGNYVRSYLEQGMDAASWTSPEKDTYVTDVYFNADAAYTFQVKYEDLARNTAETEQIAFVVDNKDPVIMVDGMVRYCTDTERRVVFKIQEENFVPENVVFDCTTTNAAGETVILNQALATTWVYDETEDLWKLELILTQEANYAFTLSYTDPSGRESVVLGTNESVYQQTITMDRTAPANVAVTCCDKEDHHHQNKTILTLKATDATAGLMAFVLTIVPDDSFQAANDWGVTRPEYWTLTIPYDADLGRLNDQLLSRNVLVQIKGDGNKPIYRNGDMTVYAEIMPGFHGNVSFTAIDLADNRKAAEPVALVVDNINPKLAVELPEAITTEPETLYYGTDVVPIELVITEANFYAADPVFKVNGVETALNWNSTNGNKTHTAVYNLKGEGHYVLTMEYTDRSGNPMKKYVSETIVIDHTSPIIEVVYQDPKVQSTHEGRIYFADTRVGTVTVTEENFVADDVKFELESRNLRGSTVSGATVSGWSDVGGNQHACVLTYSNDANYSFDLSYQDKAGNAAVFVQNEKLVEDYAADRFTVDKTAPGDITIEYSEKALQTNLNGTSFYDAQVEVTLTCTDVTAGIQEFVYSYINAPKVSGVNASLTNQTVQATRQGDSDTFLAKFTIPKSALTNTTQFNGHVTVTAVDRSKNSTTEQDGKRIVVDNISPTATVSYNTPAQTVNGTAYYADKINATITITEANFVAEDVQITVTRDGAGYTVKPVWDDRNADVHVGTFVLDREGDYIVQISYKDKSGNAMASYASGKMVIDQAAPVIRVSNVVNNSANDDDVYSFDITVEDADGNLRADDIHPVLAAVVRNENGQHIVKPIDLGNARVVEMGKTFRYTVENLKEDGIYTLSCTAADLALNSVDMMLLDDGQAYAEAQFSINRDGSTFIYGSEETSLLAEQYYVQNVNYDVVIHEINVDPIHDYSVKLNGVELKEGEGFTTSTSGGSGEWCLREYVISGALFADEGEYNIVLSSVDATNATAYSDLKGLNMTFVVDRTAPGVVVGGLKDGGRYEGTKQTVTIMPSDDGGSLGRVQILVYEDDANIDTDEPAFVAFDMEGEALWDYLNANGGQAQFEIPEGYRQTVVIVCEDQAIGEDGTCNVYREIFENVTVSSDSLVIFYANKPLFYGTLGGILGLILFLILFFMRRKKEEENTAAQA